MQKATITSKGQLTIPKQVRDQLDLKSGDRLSFEVENGSIRLRVEKRSTLEELRGSLAAERHYPGSEAERDAARKHVAEEVLGNRAS